VPAAQGFGTKGMKFAARIDDKPASDQIRIGMASVESARPRPEQRDLAKNCAGADQIKDRAAGLCEEGAIFTVGR